MTKRKTPIPADVSALKSLIQEQALKIADLEKQLATTKADAENKGNAMRHQAEKAEKAEAIIREAHDLMDACPAALPRTVTRKRPYYQDEEVEQSLIVRMGSWLGATRASS